MMVYLSCPFLKKMMKTRQITPDIGVIGLEKGGLRIQDIRPDDF